VLNCIETCVKHIYETFQCITIQQVNSLPGSVLMIVKSTFSHCQVCVVLCHIGIFFLGGGGGGGGQSDQIKH
jgi:hypothetical protein